MLRPTSSRTPTAPPLFHGHEVAITLVLIALLGVVFLKGFGEAIGIAVFIVALYLALNLIVVGNSFLEIARTPSVLANWKTALFQSYSNPFMMFVAAMAAFPRLALGLSGFETGVVVMPLIQGDPKDDPERPAGRIRNARKLLTCAALIMSLLLLTSSIVTITLIPPEAFKEGGEASGRALAYIAHTHLGDAFGTVYDLSTIFILWFAGSSAMAGLLNIVPRYLPRYGMAPDWTRATRPLVVIFSLICFVVTGYFKADVEAQAGAYATGVLALMTSATIAVTLAAKRKGQRKSAAGFGLVTLIFIYTTLDNITQQPEGLKIALFFIAAIVATSLVSRIWRTTELRVERIEMDEQTQAFLDEAARAGAFTIIANKLQSGDEEEYRLKLIEQCLKHNISVDAPVLFLEVNVYDASEFSDVMEVKGIQVQSEDRTFRVMRAEASVVPNAIAAFLLHLRDSYGILPHAYFSWSEGNPILYLIRFLLFGEGDTAPVTHEVLRRAEPDPERRPSLHVGGG